MGENMENTKKSSSANKKFAITGIVVLVFTFFNIILACNFVSSAVWNSSFENGCFAYYDFENTSNSINPAQFNLSDLYANNTDCYSGLGNCISFTPSNKINILETNNNTNPFAYNQTRGDKNGTICFWLRPDRADQVGIRVMSKESGTTTWSFSQYATGNLDFVFMSSSSPRVTNIQEKNWSFICGSFNSSHSSIFQNGTQIASQTRTYPNANDQFVYIGGNWDDTNFGGVIDELAFWNRSLSNVEIQQLYNNGLGLPRNIESVTTTLNSPANANQTSSSVVEFNITCESSVGVKNLSFFLNNALNKTITLDGSMSDTEIFSLNISEALPYYNWTAICYNNNSLSDWANSNFTLKVDTIPYFYISSPTGTLSSKSVSFNVSLFDLNASYCYYNVTRGASTEIADTNISCSNISGIFVVSSDANYVFWVWSNDSVNHQNLTNISFAVSSSVLGSGGGGGGGSWIQEYINITATQSICIKYQDAFLSAIQSTKQEKSFFKKFNVLWTKFWDYMLCKSASSIIPI